MVDSTREFSPDIKPPPINIAFVGGGDLCVELLEKTTFDSEKGPVNARILAVADENPQAPGMRLAAKLGLETVTDYHDLYNPRYRIQLIVILIPDHNILRDVLATRPPQIRILSHEVFELFWKPISSEEKKQRERNQEVETILNGIQDFILVLNPQMDIIDVNESFLKKMNYTRDQVIGHKCYEVFQRANLQCNRDEVVCPLNQAIRNNGPSQRTMTRRDSQGELRYFEVSIYPIWEKHGRISKFIEISRDVTDRKKEEEELTRRLEQMVEKRTRQLEETREKLIHQDKMASLGKLSASVVHEINNPIAGVLNLILLMKRINEEDKSTHPEIGRFNRYLGLMETETRRISRIVSNLLAFSRQVKMEKDLLDVNRLIEKTLFLNANFIKINNVRVEQHLAPDLTLIVGSADQLQQVFMNIVSNAVEAMEAKKDGTLTIETRQVPGQKSIQVIFRDTGVGIPEHHRQRLFEPFFTTKKNGKGVGLGLSVAYGIIQEHGGTVHVRSKPGEGTEFTVELPLEHKQGLQKKGGGRDE
jgi:PAS domain S-box-containing protein